jgi:phosphate transport system substrate-binding protein
MTRRVVVIAICVPAVVLAACGPLTVQRPAAEAPAVPPGGGLMLTGAGATFPFPLYSKWSQVYAEAEGVQVNYQSIGSGGGIRQFIARTVDFGASDLPMTDEQLARAGGAVLHIPTVAGAVVPVYNLAGVKAGLSFSGELLAAIFLGRITRWDDPQIVRLNPGVRLPAEEIVVVHRSDGSGTTAIWTNFLARVSPEWQSGVGEGTSVSWPTGLAAKGNEGVAALIKRLPNAVGYVELGYAATTGLDTGRVRNRAGRFILPSVEGTTAAVAGAVGQMPKDFRIVITDPIGPDAYPIAGFTWLLVREQQPDVRRGRALAEFLWWATHEGQRFAAPLHYAPLPPQVVDLLEGAMRRMTAAGQHLLP